MGKGLVLSGEYKGRILSINKRKSEMRWSRKQKLAEGIKR